jgi:hypothetical protein
MGLFDKVRQVLAKAEQALPGSGRAADDQELDDRAFNERVYEDRDEVLGTAQPEPAGAPDDDDDPDPRTAAVDSEVEQRTPQRYRTHTIQPGQSLAEVAELHGVGVEQVAELNGLDPELVFAGQVVRIPHA